MNEYLFKAYFKDLKTGVPFIVPISKVSSTIEAAKQRVYVDCHRYEIAHECKLLYIYYDSDMISAIIKSAKEGASNEN